MTSSRGRKTSCSIAGTLEWDYRYTDVFPQLSRDGKLVFTEKAKNSSIVTVNPDGSDRRRIFDTDTSGLDATMVQRGMAGAFQPSWSPDGQWVAFGLGEWFQSRRTGNARIMRVRRDGTGLEALTDGTIHAGFPSYSADGKEIVFRVWGERPRTTACASSISTTARPAS